MSTPFDNPRPPTPPRPATSSRRPGALVITAIVLIAAFMLLSAFAGFWTERLWFGSVGYADVFTTLLLTKIGLFLVFAGLMAAVVAVTMAMAYRFRPNPKDHRESLYECFFLLPKPKDGSVPETAEVVVLKHGQSFKEAAGMDPGFGAILDQDTDNLTMQQEGLEASAKHGLTLGNYQEIRVRHFEQAVDKYMAMEPKLPHDILYRPKRGFAVPLARWFRGPLRARVRDAVLGERLGDTGWFDRRLLERLVDEHQSAARDHSPALWALLMFESFLRNVADTGAPREASRAADLEMAA